MTAIERKRLVVLRGLPKWGFYGKVVLPPDRECVIVDGVRAVQVPMRDYDRGGFGVIELTWDGIETTVLGLPVYR